jgi:acetyl/propionyl-CoA carboxylase alpha subunit
MSGHAFEARIYAENVPKGFLPATGVLNHYRPVAVSPSVRVETGVEQGDTVSMHYDPMIAKLVVWGGNRGEALVKLKDCLSNFQVDSLRTCILELSAILIIPQHNYKSSRPYGSIVNFLRNLFEFLAHRFLVTTIVQ